MKVQQKAVLLAGLSYIAIALLHIPDRFFPHGFDKNAPVQLFSLLAVATIYLVYIAIKSERFRFSRLTVFGVLGLVFTQLASVTMSGNLLGSLVGDTGRYVGSMSVFALLVISIFHSQFNFAAFIKLLRFYIGAIELLCLIAIGQHFEWLELPGDHGMTATLGNLDFFAAFIGTSLPLLFLVALYSSQRGKAVLSLLAVLNIYALYLAGPLQGFLDIAFTVVGIAIYLGRKWIPRQLLVLRSTWGENGYRAESGLLMHEHSLERSPSLSGLSSSS